MPDLITADLVRLDVGLGDDKQAAIASLAEVVRASGRTERVDQLVADAMAREGQSATGLPGGVAIPHCRTEAVSEPTLAFARLSSRVDFDALDGPADLVFLICAPAGSDSTHLRILTQLARALVKADFTNSLRAAQTPQEVADLVTATVSVDTTPSQAPNRAPSRAPSRAPGPAAAPPDAKPSLAGAARRYLRALRRR